MEFICGNSPHVKAVGCFHREAPSLMFDRILNVTLPEDKVSTTGVTKGNLKLLLRSSSFFFFFFFLSGFSFSNIHDSRDSWGRGRVSI